MFFQMWTPSLIPIFQMRSHEGFVQMEKCFGIQEYEGSTYNSQDGIGLFDLPPHMLLKREFRVECHSKVLFLICSCNNMAWIILRTTDQHLIFMSWSGHAPWAYQVNTRTSAVHVLSLVTLGRARAQLPQQVPEGVGLLTHSQAVICIMLGDFYV